MRTQAQVDAAIVRHVRDYWRRHVMVIGYEPKRLSFEGELGDLCAEPTVAEPPTSLIVTPGTGAC